MAKEEKGSKEKIKIYDKDGVDKMYKKDSGKVPNNKLPIKDRIPFTDAPDHFKQYFRTLMGIAYQQQNPCPECKDGKMCPKHILQPKGSDIADLLGDAAKTYVQKELAENGQRLFYAAIAYKIADELDSVQKEWPKDSYKAKVLRAVGANYATLAGLDAKIFGYEAEKNSGESPAGKLPPVRDGTVGSSPYRETIKTYL